MRLKTDGLIIKESAVGESDKLVTVLTADMGVIRAFARRARNLKSKNASSTGMLCYSHLSLFKSKDTYNIDEAEAVEVFFGLRGDIEKTSLAQYFCEVCMHVGVEEQTGGEVLRLMLNCLYFLAQGQRSPEMIKAIFELRMMSLCGFLPDLGACSRCGAVGQDRMFFDLRGGTLMCADCATSGLTPVGGGILAAMRHISSCEFSRLFMFSLPDDGMKALSSVTEGYLTAQTGRGYKTLDFYKSVQL